MHELLDQISLLEELKGDLVGLIILDGELRESFVFFLYKIRVFFINFIN